MGAPLLLPVVSFLHKKLHKRCLIYLTLSLTLLTVGSLELDVSIFGQEESKAKPSYTIENIKEKYLQGVISLTAAYRKSHVVAEVSEKRQLEGSIQTRSYQLELLRRDDKEKTVATVLDGKERGKRSICVAAPELSFLAEKPLEGQPMLKNISELPNQTFEEFRDYLDNQSDILRAPFSFFEMPIPELFSSSSTKITGVSTEQLQGHNVIRVQLQLPPFTKKLEKSGIDVIKGWVLLDPDNGWRSHGFRFEYFDKSGKQAAVFTGEVEYGDPIDGNPVPRSVHYVSSLFTRVKNQTDRWAKLKSVKFGPIDSSEFTLEGNGIDYRPYAPQRFPILRSPWFYGPVLFAIFFTAAILILRKKRQRA